MAVLSDDMGGITAYAAAVNRGYTGTKEEFEQLMYSYTEVAERAEAAAGNAHESEENSIEAKDIAVSAKNEAVSARDAAQSARDASIAAKNNSESARDATISAKNDTLAAKDAVMSAKSSVDETSANFSDEVTAAISDVNAAGRNQKELAKTHAVDSEAWAVGQREGADVGVSDATYHNNSKYYAEQSALAKSETETARDTAITAKNDAVSAKNEAETAKGEAQDIVDGINAKSEQIDQNAEDITALQTAMETKAEIDGYYEDMTVGDAEQLVSSKYVEDSEPYLYRTSGGYKDIGNREYVGAIVGGTVNWNQLVKNGDFSAGSNNWGTATAGTAINSVDSNILTMSCESINSGIQPTQKNAFQNGHKYFKTVDVKSFCKIKFDVDGEKTKLSRESGNWETLSNVFEWNFPTGSYSIYIRLTNNATTFGEVQVKNVMLIDLTDMFGTAIADYIYTLEQTTAGAGVAFFCKLFPNDYYEYNVGELKSVEGVSAHEMVGFNQWDEEWEAGGLSADTGIPMADLSRIRCKNFIKVIGNTQYYFAVGNSYENRTMAVHAYDSNKNHIRIIQYVNSTNGWGIRTPLRCRYIKFASVAGTIKTYNHDICINLSWSGRRNGEYEPYVKHSYPLDSSLTLRGIPKLDAHNNLYYDGDRYLPDGKVERRYGVVDLGTLTWKKSISNENFFYCDASSWTTVIASRGVICAKYTVYTGATASTNLNGLDDKTLCINKTGNGYIGGSTGNYADGALLIRDSAYSNVVDFKAAMSGVYLVYQLITPTTEEAEPYAEIQICDDFGTEEFVSTGIVPVGHETRYPANLRDKLQHLPDLADDDGYYMISQQNKNMSLELFRIPKAPTTDGAYILKATVSGGTPTYTWEAEE